MVAVVTVRDIRDLEDIERISSLVLERELVQVIKNPSAFPKNSTNFKPIKRYGDERDVLDAIISALRPADFLARLRELSGEVPIIVDGVSRTTRTRNTYAEPHRWSASFCAAYFRALGYMVQVQNFNVGSTPTQNIIAIKRGTTTPNDVFVLGAHYDSTSQTPATVAPGAVDNGSGSSGIMILAEAFSRYSFKSTVHFILFGGEEQGLVGSTFYVNRRGPDNVNIRSALIMDMIAYSNRFYGVIIEGTRNAAISALMDRYEAALRLWSPRLTIQKNYNSFGSDHVPFQRAGIPAFLAIEQDDTNYPHYHRSTDTIQWCNPDQSVDIVKGLAALMYAQLEA